MKVAELRDLTGRLERLLYNVTQCATMAELQSVARSLKSCGLELINATCKTAKREDLERKERAIDRSSTAINSILLD